MVIQIMENPIKGTHIACRVDLKGDECVYTKYALEISGLFKEVVPDGDTTREIMFYDLENGLPYEVNGYYFDGDWMKFGTVKTIAEKSLTEKTGTAVINRLPAGGAYSG